MLFSPFISADTSLVFSGDSANNTMYIKDGRMQMANDTNNTVIYDNNKKEFITIDHKKHTYMVMTQQDMEDIGNMANNLMKEMESKLAQLPASQREMMKNMMKSQMASMMPELDEPVMHHTGEHKKIAGFNCEVVTVHIKDKLMVESCVADANEVGIPQKDMQVFSGMQEFIKSLMEKLPMVGNSMQLSSMNPREIPVAYTQGSNHGELESVSTDSLDDSLFEVPARYKQKKMPKMGR